MPRIVYFGSDSFSRSVLEKLFDSGQLEFSLLVTTPVKRSGRGRRKQENPILNFGKEKGIPVIAPEKLGDEDILSRLSQAQADIFLVVSYGKMIPNSVLGLPRVMPINLHPSLLPKWRGASPIQSALSNGEKITGVSVIKITEQLDAGEIVFQESFEVGEDVDFFELEKRCIDIGVELILQSIKSLLEGSVKLRAQDEERASYSKKINKTDGEIKWSSSAEDIHNQVRAFRDWPIATTEFNGKKLRVLKSSVNEVCSGNPGEVVELSKDGFALVATGRGCLKIFEVQLEGKKATDILSFSRGYPFQVGTQLGDV